MMSIYSLNSIKLEQIQVIFLKCHHTSENKIIDKVYILEEYISLLVYSVPDLKRIPFKEAIQQEFRPTRLGEWFGPSWVK